MKKCYSCGALVPNEAKFCVRCGKPMSITNDLIERAKMDDQDAIRELYGRTYNRLLFHIQAKVPDLDTAEDLAQDVYIKAFTHLDQLQDPSAFPGWLLSIARNRVSDWYRKYSREKDHTEYSKDDYTDDGSAEEEIESLPEYRPAMVPDEYMDREETARLVGEILDTLPEGQRIVLVMYYYEQLSVKEIAEELGLNINTVKTRMSMGKKKVEAKVRELEKKGTKLYTLAPIPFLFLLLHTAEDSAVEAQAAEMPAALMSSIQEKLAVSYAGNNTGANTVQQETNTASETPANVSSSSIQGTVKTAGTTVAKGIGMKAVVGIVIAAAVVGGAALAVTKPWQDNGASTAEAEDAVEEETEEGVVEEEEPAAITTWEELYAAYASIVEDYEEEYGEGGYADYGNEDIVGQNTKYMTGTFLLELVDFDNDGWEELLIGVEDPSQHDPDFSSDTFMADTWVDVWALVDGEVQKVYYPDEMYIFGNKPSNLSYGNDVSTCIQYNTYSDGTKCMQQSEIAGGDNGAMYVYTDNIFQEDSSREDETPVSYIWYNTLCSVDQAGETLSVTEQTKITLGLLEVSSTEKSDGEDWRELYADYLQNADINISNYTANGSFFLIYLNNDDIPELLYYASMFAESSGIIYIQNGEVMVQEINNGWAEMEYSEQGGYISATLYQMETGVEEVCYLDESCTMEEIFRGTFGYTGSLTDDPKYYLYDYGPVGYSYYSIEFDGNMATVTEDQYLQEHSTKYSWRSSENNDIIDISDLEPVANGTDAMLEYLVSSN